MTVPPVAVISERNFVRLAAAAISTGRTLQLNRRRVKLCEPYRLGSNHVLRIAGGSIHGDGHSLLQVEGTRRGLLELVDIQLRHFPSAERTEKRSQGAAVFVRGKGQLALRACEVSSEGGFGLWLVQKASATAHDCTFPGPGARSAVVSFENSRLALHNCRFDNAEPHAVCARGTAALIVHNCTIVGSALRAIYCYHSARLDMSGCHISGTRSTTAAAIQVDALRPGDAASLSLSCTTFEDNAGGDLSVSGNVERIVTDCTYHERDNTTELGTFANRERDVGYHSGSGLSADVDDTAVREEPEALNGRPSRSPYDLWREGDGQ